AVRRRGRAAGAGAGLPAIRLGGRAGYVPVPAAPAGAARGDLPDQAGRRGGGLPALHGRASPAVRVVGGRTGPGCRALRVVDGGGPLAAVLADAAAVPGRLPEWAAAGAVVRHAAAAAGGLRRVRDPPHGHAVVVAVQPAADGRALRAAGGRHLLRG